MPSRPTFTLLASLAAAVATGPLVVAAALPSAALDTAASRRAATAQTAQAAHAARPAVSQADSVIWSQTTSTGTVDHIIDGDTVAVHVDGDPGDLLVHVRNAGIQAMETGECHAAQATTNLAALLPTGARVRMSAEVASTSSLGRPVRYVDRLDAGGVVTDVQLAQLAAGHVLPMTMSGARARWSSYYAQAQAAYKKSAPANLWDNDFCGSGPSQSSFLSLLVMWDANGYDDTNVNGEYVRVINWSTSSVDASGWWIRTGGQDSFVLPAGATIPAGGTLTLYVGKGTATTTRFYWGSSVPKFGNVDTGVPGSGAFLYDPQGDVRARATFPCLTTCGDPLAGKVRMAVTYDAAGDDFANVNGESVRLRNVSTSTIDLSYRDLAANGYTYELPKGSTLAPGETVTVRVGTGTTSRLTQYWGNAKPILTNSGGAVVLRNAENVRVTCSAWGTGRC